MTQLNRSLDAKVHSAIQATDGSRVIWVRVLAVVALLAGLSIFHRVFERALSSGLGLLVLAVLIGFAWMLLRTLPALGRLFERRLLQARLADARVNPVDELVQQLVERTNQLDRYRNALATIAAQIQALRELVDTWRGASERVDVAKQQAALVKMQSFYALHVARLRAAELALTEYKQHMNTRRLEWEFAQAGEAVLAALRTSGSEEVVRELMGDEAARTIHARFNRVFGALDTDLATVEALQAGESVTLKHPL